MGRASPQLDDQPEVKRRKVRKGTQSCWECRRRKVRCIFATSNTTDTCENCRRRQTECVSQESPDEPAVHLGNNNNKVEARLGRVEGLIEHLVDSAVTAHIPSSPAKDLFEGIPTPVVSEVEQSTCPRPLERLSPTTANSSTQSTRAACKYEGLSRALTASWPSQRDIDLICTLPIGLSAHLHRGICTPYSSSMGPGQPSPREILQLPPPDSHPILIARKLLVLGTFLQGAPPSSIQGLIDLGASYRDIMSRVVDTAIRLVTTDEELIGSVEGIECIMIEAMYQNYAGNLHRSWMAVRRATTVAQMMALHRGLKSPSLKILEPETRAVFDPDQIIFRLVEMDRYLSLMLGLPRNSLEARFATPQALDGCQPIDRMQRLQCAMGDRILQRNEQNLSDSDTHNIDMLLQKAAAEMPPQWWLIPNLSTNDSGGTEVLHETIRFMNQFTHFHLLVRLHLPYMLRSSPDHIYDHSKITAVNASRETLARFVVFRTSNPAHFYCRGIDFLAFISATVLCLAHIDSRGRRQASAKDCNPGTISDSLAHSRPSDRGMMERTLEIIESMARIDNDAIASRISRILRHLLAIEANAASGASYSINLSAATEEEIECHGKLTNDGKGLHVHIPYFGTINFEHNQHPPPEPNYPPPYQTSSQVDLLNAQTAQLPLGQPTSSQQTLCTGSSNLNFNNDIQEVQLPALTGTTGAEDDWDLQGVDVALFDSLFRGTVVPDAIDEETWTQWA